MPSAIDQWQFFSPKSNGSLKCSVSTKHKWLDRAIQLAITSKEESLIETLIYVLKNDISLNYELFELVTELIQK